MLVVYDDDSHICWVYVAQVYVFGAVCVACLTGQPLVRTHSTEQKFMQSIYKVLGTASQM